MRVAIYQFQNAPGGCPACNQGSRKMIFAGREACRDKANELFGEGCEFSYYIDYCETRLTGDQLHEVKNRPNLLMLLDDIANGKVDAVAMLYMGDLSIEQEFILAFYRYLKDHNVKLITVKEGLAIMDMLDEVLTLDTSE